MKKSSFKLKPGQLCTINGHVYQAKKFKLETCNKSICLECEKTNKVYCIAIVENFPYPCYRTFDHLMYPKLIK